MASDSPTVICDGECTYGNPDYSCSIHGCVVSFASENPNCRECQEKLNRLRSRSGEEGENG